VVHATGMAVPPRSAPLVVTVHDLAFLEDPSRSTRRGRRFFLRSVELARAEADLVVVPSEATRRECLAFGFDPGRVRVVPWGVDDRRASADDVAAVRRRHRLEQPYVLFVGTVEPRKNLPGLLAAWRALDRAGVELVVVGPTGWGDDLEPLVAGLRGVRRLGAVAAGELPGLYAGAELFCLPSHREGFGLPVLEAMAQGTPVVTSRGTATEEVAGEAGSLVNPGDVDGLVAAIAALLDDPAQRDRASAAALVRAAELPWRRTADGLADAYREVAGRRARRVGVDLLWLVPGDVGGTETYATRLLDAWVRTKPAAELAPVVLANRRFADAYPELAAALPLVVAPVSGTSRVRRVLVENLWLPWIGWRLRLDLLHHLGGTAPVLGGRPTVLTLHDLQPLSNPETFHPLKRRYLHHAIPRAAAKAAVVTTLSEFVRDDVRHRLGVPPGRLRVVPPGFDPPRRAHAPAGAGDEAGDAAGLPAVSGWHRVAARYDLGDRPFFLYPAITYPHKDHLLLVEALAALGPEPLLVLTSSAGDAEPALRDRIASLGLGHQIRRTGSIPRADLDELYTRAVALVYPSRYEGFGLPVLEAMDLGCPVVAADDTGLREVVDGAGLLLAPGDLAAWVGAMRRLLEDADERRRLIALGAERVRRFDWDASAEALAAAYRQALEPALGVAAASDGGSP
jgi:glycosyltransferase involved in cell wall biosynthesis